MSTPRQAGSMRRPDPLRPLGRSWRRLRRRPRAMQVRTVLLVLAVVVGLIIWLTLAPSGTPGSPEGAGAAEVPVAASLASTSAPTPVSQASTSARGVTAHAINVVFPVISLSTACPASSTSRRTQEFGEQDNAIHVYVNQINAAGGINGRKINPIIVPFDPTNTTEQRALCKQWTQGNPPVFAVLDGIGTWVGDNQLCITQEGHTPMIGAWSTITEWTELGSPYLWWTGADDAPVLAAVVDWGMSSGRLGHGKKVGVVVADQASDQAALNDVPFARPQEGRHHPEVETISADLGETASTDSDATLAVERLKAAGVQSVVPLLPVNALLPYLGAETSQKYFPQLLLSDYQSGIETALGLIPVPYEQALNGQEGVTTETAGRGRRPPNRRVREATTPACFLLRHVAQGVSRAVSRGRRTITSRSRGPSRHGAALIRLFAHAATKAGKDLNRRTFVEGLGVDQEFRGHPHTDLELRSKQDVRTDDVHRGGGAQQRATFLAVHPGAQQQAPGHVLGRRAEVQAAPLGLGRAGSEPASAGTRACLLPRARGSRWRSRGSARRRRRSPSPHGGRGDGVRPAARRA